MVGIGKHVHRLDAADAVAALADHVQVPGQGLRIAGDVDNALGRCFQQGADEALVAAGAGRVHEHHIGPVAVRDHLLHVFPRVPLGKPAVFHAVEPGVDNGVLHRVAV